MTIFISIPWFLPAYKAGGPIQSIVNLVNNFSENVAYYIFCGDTDLNNDPLQNITKGEWVQYNNHTKIWYAQQENLSDTLATQIECIKPDVLYIIGLFNWHFNIVPLLFCKADKKILSVRGMLHPGALSQKQLKKRIFLAALKIFGIAGKTIFHATDETEAAFIKKEFGTKATIRVATNFAKTIIKKEPLKKTAGSLQMLTTALISPMKNHLQVLKALMFCNGNISYNIYGPIKDTAYWELCTKQIEKLPQNVSVKYHGEILPTQVENILAQHHVFIMPSKSENFGHAIAEALVAGKPVITSNATPWNGLQYHNAGINVEPTENAIADAINFFTSLNNDEYKNDAEAASTYAESKLNLAEKINAYRNLFFN
ncbi:MAG: glycosyltransferase [Ferruginibacter sp.]|nr:glycosyltransferase [Ferruginibacter sp.]